MSGARAALSSIAALAALVCAWPGRTGTAHAAIFGADDRIALPDTYKALKSSIGLLTNDRTRTVCTAFCVGDAIIATAGHCLFRTGGEPAPPAAGFRFSRPGVSASGGARIAGAADGTAGLNIVAGSPRLSVKPPINAPADWALVRLDAPVCAGHVLPLQPIAPEQVAQAANVQRLFMVGYHRDFANWGLAYSQPCAAGRGAVGRDWGSLMRDFVKPEQLILHTCDSASASSGSPLLIDGPRGPSVIGINVGTYVQSQVETQDGEVTRRYTADTVGNTGVAAQAFGASLAAFRASVGVTADTATVRAIETSLTALGHYGGAIDGRFGTDLRAAITAYEQAQGLPVLGLPTRGLLRRLTGPETVTTSGEPGSAPSAPQAGRVRATPGRS